ncbi:MAG: FAD-dependent oxidoreductase [Rhodospirillaceae bacterium]|nr:FAD-dependent oxidoreductase [Rhodospirillaceae bacterium]MBT6202872.1 FAD-dependent oxidoreductase [Rhodospirillaceae bacterium]MBT7615035.1 FAD-dependent oxidoreductase [Rhodospirillaceae bacterium]
MANDVDVVIIGAGSAGLSAAKAAAASGLTFTVVEASHRIGGRAYTEEFAQGQPFDLGCHWMHSASLNPFVAIADQHGFSYRKDNEWNQPIHNAGSWIGEDERAAVQALSEANDKAIAAAAAQGRDCAVADVVDLEDPWAAFHAYWFSLGVSRDIDQSGVVDVCAYNDTNENWPVTEGYGALVAAWAADVPVTLNAPVKRIRLTAGGVEVVTSQGTIKGRTALVTVSSNVLSSGRIIFEPGLPDWKSNAARKLPLGVHNRIGVMLDDNPLAGSDRENATVMLEDDEVPLALEVGPYGYSYVVGVTGGRFGSWLERAGQQASVEYLVERMKAVWGNDIAKHVTDRVIVTAWEGDPWTLGSYSAATPGNAHQRAELARPIDGRIFFAGEATSSEFFSTCHGAYLTGIRAANEIAELLGGNR